jgi:hypothetical protein
MRPTQKAFTVFDHQTGKNIRVGGYAAYDALLKYSAEAGLLTERCVPADYIVRETIKMCEATKNQVERERRGYKYGGNATMHAAWSYDQTFGAQAKHFKEAARALKDKPKEKLPLGLRKQNDAREEARHIRLLKKAQENQRFYMEQQKEVAGGGRLKSNSTLINMSRLPKDAQTINIGGRLYSISRGDGT